MEDVKVGKKGVEILVKFGGFLVFGSMIKTDFGFSSINFSPFYKKNFQIFMC